MVGRLEWGMGLRGWDGAGWDEVGGVQTVVDRGLEGGGSGGGKGSPLSIRYLPSTLPS